MKKLAAFLVVLCSALIANAQVTTPVDTGEKRVSLNEAAVAFDGTGAAALEATLRTTALNGSPDAPVTNARLLVKNVSPIPYAFVSGVATLYDSAGVRCGEGVFTGDAAVASESFETDPPGVRIRCEAASWPIVATFLLPRIAPNQLITRVAGPTSYLEIVIAGESHPIELDKPLVLTLGERRRTLLV